MIFYIYYVVFHITKILPSDREAFQFWRRHIFIPKNEVLPKNIVLATCPPTFQVSSANTLFLSAIEAVSKIILPLLGEKKL